jgi:hypothetical protein
MSHTSERLQAAVERAAGDFANIPDFQVMRRSSTLIELQRKREEGESTFGQTALEKADISPAEFDRIQANVRKGIDEQNFTFNDVVEYMKYEGIEPNVDMTPAQLNDEQQLGLDLANFAKGSIEGTFNLVSLPFMLTDAFVGGIKAVASDDFKFHLPASGVIQGIGRDLSDSLFNLEGAPENFETRAAKKVGEFVVPGAFITKGLTTAGAKLALQAPEALNFMQKAFVHMAKNPAKLQFLEIGMNSGAAIAGETAVQLAAQGGDPNEVENAGWIRFGAEIGAVLGLGFGQRLLAKFSDFARRKIVWGAAHQKRAAEIQVGEVFNEIMEADPNILNNIAVTEALEKELGIKLTADVAFQNPDIAAMVQNAVRTSPNKAAATRFVRLFEAERERLRQYSNKMTPIIEKSDNLQKDLGVFLDDELTKVQNRIDETVAKAVDEAQLLHPERSHIELGEAGFTQLKVFQKEADDMVEGLYNSLDNTVEYSVSHIQAGMLKSKFSPRFAEENVRRTIAGEPVIGAKGTAQEFGGVHKDLLDSMELNFGPGTKKTDLATIRDMRAEINSFITIEKNGETIARLMAMKKGIDNQLKIGARSARGKAATVFKQANKMREEIDIKFDSGFARIALQEDLHGIKALSPESFWKTWVQPGDAKTAVNAARQFKRIFMNDKTKKLDPVIESLVTDYVAYNLNKSISAGKLDLTGIENWLLRHETSLKELGVWNKFDDVGKAQARATEVTIQGVLDRREIERSILQSVIKTRNLRGFIRKEIDGGGIAEIAKKVEETGSRPAIRAFKKEVWDTLLDSANTGRLDSVEKMIKSPDTMLVKLLEHETVLRSALDNKHYEALTTLARGVRRIEGRVETFGRAADELSKGQHTSQRQMGQAFSKIRASLQGFVSPQFTAIQLANQGLDIMSSNSAVGVIEEAMYNWRYAVELAKNAKNRSGRRAIRTIWSAAAVSAANFEHDDARTER